MRFLSNNFPKCIILLGSFVFVLLIIPNFLLAQTEKIDRLVHSLGNHLGNADKVDILNEISWEFHVLDNTKTLEYAKEAHVLASQINYQRGIGRALNLMATGYYAMGNIDKGIELNKQTLKIGKKTQDCYLIAKAANNLGNFMYEKGKFKESLELYHQSLECAETLHDTLSMAFTYENIGTFHQAMGNDEKAEYYLIKAMKIGKQSNDPIVLLSGYYNLAILEKSRGNEEAAIYNFKESYEIAKKINDLSDMAAIKIEEAKIYIASGNQTKAIESIKNAINFSKEINDESILPTYYLELANVYLLSGMLDNAGAYAKKCIENEISNVDNELFAYDILHRLYHKKGDYELAYDYLEKSHDIKERVFSDDKKMEVNKLEEFYQSKRKDKENAILLAHNKEQDTIIQHHRLLNTLLGIIIILIVLVGFLLGRAFRIKNKSHKLLEGRVIKRTKELSEANEKLKESNEELERFAHIASHDMKEPLRNISSFVKLLERKTSFEEGSSEKECMDFIIRNTNQMHQLIEDVLKYSKLSNGKMEMDEVDLNHTVENIRLSLDNSYLGKDVNIKVISDLPIVHNHKVRMHLLFKNIIENGIKYNQNENPTIEVNCRRDNSQYVFSIADNGIGIEKEYFSKIFEMFRRLHNRSEYDGTGLGLSISKKIIDTMGGEIWLESEVGCGTTFHFSIPKPTMDEAIAA